MCEDAFGPFVLSRRGFDFKGVSGEGKTAVSAGSSDLGLQYQLCLVLRKQ